MFNRRNIYLYPPINLVRKAGRQAFDSLSERITGKPACRPWMLLEETDIICDLLRAQQPTRCLEWGAGSSTLYFPSFLPPGSQWLAIEHVRDWASKIESLIPAPNVGVVYVGPNRLDVGQTAGDGSYEEFRDYVEYPRGTYDFILIDGRARAPCLLKAKSLVAPGGVVVLHDANRLEYRVGTSIYPHQVSFTGRGKGQLGLWLGSPSVPIADLIDLRPHQAMWLFYEKLGKILRR